MINLYDYVTPGCKGNETAKYEKCKVKQSD